MKIERTKVLNMDEAIYGMRNPMNSWDKSDSFNNVGEFIGVGPNDNELAKKLIRAGTDHRKFLRQIFISCFMMYMYTDISLFIVIRFIAYLF